MKIPYLYLISFTSYGDKKINPFPNIVLYYDDKLQGTFNSDQDAKNFFYEKLINKNKQDQFFQLKNKKTGEVKWFLIHNHPVFPGVDTTLIDFYRYRKFSLYYNVS